MTKSKFNKAAWFRVTKQNVCQICKKEDWCCFADTGAILCMRVPSNRPSQGMAGGWLHNIGDTHRIPYVPIPKPIISTPEIDCEKILSEWGKQSTPQSLIIFAEKLGVDPMSLYALGCVWSHENNAWAFPMKNENKKCIGIRLRNEVGQKWAVRYSKSGLFIPTQNLNPKETLFICEGPTDTAASLCLGLQAIGRPSCQGLEEVTNNFIHINKIRSVVLVADNDDPGINGMGKLQSQLTVNSCILILPSKDMREFYCSGGTKVIIDSILKNLIWTKN